MLGQLVSVAMAAKLTGKVVAAFGEPLIDALSFTCFQVRNGWRRPIRWRLKALGIAVARAQGADSSGASGHQRRAPLVAPDNIEAGMKQDGPCSALAR